MLCNGNLQQNKTTLNSNTLCLHRVLVDDCPACFALPCDRVGEQKMVANNEEIGLTFNGLHCFLPFESPMENNFRECKSVELMSLSEHNLTFLLIFRICELFNSNIQLYWNLLSLHLLSSTECREEKYRDVLLLRG